VLAVEVHDAGSPFTQRGRQPVLPHPWVFHQVVVYGHYLVIVEKRHDAPFAFGQVGNSTFRLDF